MRRSLIALALAAVLPAASLHAATVAYDVPDGTTGNQSYTGTMSMLFEVNKTIRVEALGAFDDDQDGIAGTLTTELWSRSGITGDSVLATMTFTTASAGTLGYDGQGLGSRFKTISPLILTPGEYAITGYGYSGADRNGNEGSLSGDNWTTNDGGGAISFVGDSIYAPTAGGTIGTIEDNGPADRYAAGTFAYSVVPVPASLPLLLAGVAAFFGLGRLRRRAA